MKTIEESETKTFEAKIPKEIIAEISKLDIESLEKLYNDVVELSSNNEEFVYYNDDLKLIYQQEIFDKLKYLSQEQIAEIRARIFGTEYTQIHKKRK